MEDPFICVLKALIKRTEIQHVTCELSRNRGTFAKVLTHSLKSNLGRKWEKLPSSNERWTDKSIPDWFCKCLKKKKKKKKRLWFSATKLLEKQRVPLLSICRIMDRYLRNTAVSIWPPKLYRNIFGDLPLWQVHENDTALFRRHMALHSSAETPPHPH